MIFFLRYYTLNTFTISISYSTAAKTISWNFLRSPNMRIRRFLPKIELIMFTVVVTFSKTTILPLISLLVCITGANSCFEKKISASKVQRKYLWILRTCQKHWNGDLTLRRSLHLHWKNFNYDSLKYTHNFYFDPSPHHFVKYIIRWQKICPVVYSNER